MRPRQPKRDRRGSRSTTSVLLGASCKSVSKKTKLKFVLSFKQKNSKKTRKVKSVTLTNGVPRVVKVHRVLRKGDRVILSRAIDQKARIPAVKLEGILKSPRR